MFRLWVCCLFVFVCLGFWVYYVGFDFGCLWLLVLMVWVLLIVCGCSCLEFEFDFACFVLVLY